MAKEMTNEEAVRYMEDLQRLFTQYRPIFSGNMVKANGKAIEALEKQIPKKPNIERQGICSVFRCPDCNKVLINKYNDEFVVGEKEEFCCECGQHIDWSDEK